jgi:putative flavoprotein involved in K+ transport
MPCAYVPGLPWLYPWGSGRFVGVGHDAGFPADRIVEHLAPRQPARTLATAAT